MSATMRHNFHKASTSMLTHFMRALFAVVLLAFASHSIAQVPQFRSSSTMNGAGTLSFPIGSTSTDWLVMSVISTTSVATPSGWTLSASRNWTAYGYSSYVFTRQQGSAASVVISPTSGSAIIVAYQNTTGIGAVGTFTESTAAANSISPNSITPQNANSKVLGIVTDRDVTYPTPPAGFLSSLNFNSSYFGQNISERAYGNTAPTGPLAWGQSTTYPAVGILIELLPLSGPPPIVQAPQFRASSTLNGTGTLNFPVGSTYSDWLVMSVISTSAVATPSGWTLATSRNWTAYAYYSYVFTRQQGSATSVTLSPASGSAAIVAYKNSVGIGAAGTFAESTAAANTLSLNAITPQNANSTVLGIVTDRDVVYPTPPTNFISSLNFNSSYFGQNIAERAYGSTAPTGTPAWGQSTTYPAVGVLIELLPIPLMPPAMSVAFSPTLIFSGSTTTATFTLTNANIGNLTTANFTAPLTNLSVASPTIGGTCNGVTNSPALVTGATALNLSVPSLPIGGCTITLSLTSAIAGTQALTTSGVTTTQTPTAGAASNTANFTVTSTPFNATITNAFTPAWIAQGGTSTLTFTLTSPSAVALSNATFTDMLNGMTVASATTGGTCAGVSNSPALAVGANALNMTIPTLPATGCTLTVQVTSAVLGSNANVTSGVTSVQTVGVGAVSNTAYLTVSVADVGFSYVHADHLGTPRAITRPSDNAVVWKWENSDPFGANTPNEDPANTGTAFKYNLRFPGQYYDQETQTHYNYYRDYDPSTGRYIESDPIGLKGGISTYAYVGSAPLVFFDPLGLQAYECKRPLGSKPGPDVREFDPLYHRYSCVKNSDGTYACGGQTIAKPGLFGSARPTTPKEDYYDSNACKVTYYDNTCFEKCLQDEWKKERPYYGAIWGIGTSCKEYDQDLNNKCRKDCGLK